MAFNQDIKNHLEVHRALPTPPMADMDDVPQRGSPYGAAYVESIIPTKHVLSDEGSYFCTTNPTPGTVLAYGSGGTQASFSDTVPFMTIKNNDTPGQKAKRVQLDYIKIIQIGGTAPASTTSVQMAIKLDNINRASTAGTPVAATIQNPNMDATQTGVGQLFYYTGAVATIPASGPSARVVARCQLKGGPTLVLDEYSVIFGAVDSPPQGGYLTTVSSYITRAPPVIIGPQQWAVIHLWLPAAATNPFSYEFEVGWWER